MKISVKGEDRLELSTIFRQLKMKSPFRKENVSRLRGVTN